MIDRYGIPPELVPDFIGLKGDTSDNIPGVPGIGDKTAAELLQQFGSLEDVLANVDKISGAKRKENLIEHAEDARVSKQLATLIRDVDVDIDPLAEVAREPDRSRLREVFREFELRDPLRRLEEALGAAEAAAPATAAEVELDRDAARGRPGRDRRAGASGDVVVALVAPEVPEGELFAGEEAWRFGGRRRGTRCSPATPSAPGPRGRGRRSARRDRPRRQGVRQRAGQPRPRHDGRRLPARPRAPRLPVRGAGRGARARQHRRGRPRRARRCWSTRWPTGSARSSPSAGWTR